MSNPHRERDPMEHVPEAAQLLSELASMMQSTEAAVGFLDQLAAAVMPPDRRDIAHLTYSDHGAEHREHADPRAAAEARLKAAEKRFHTLVEQIPAVTFMAVLGEGKNEVYVSPHIEQMLGFTQEEWLENPFLWYRQLHVDDRHLWNLEFSRGVRAGGPFKAECRFLARDGHVVWVHGEARIIKDEHGRPSLLQGIAFDITEIKKAQDVLVRDAVEKAKEQEELAIARRIQEQMLPRAAPVVNLEWAGGMRAAEDVGGDYYDVLPTVDGAWIGIGDVAGHGLSAGLIMLLVQSAVASVTRARPFAAPREVISIVNATLFDAIRDRLGRDEHITFSLFRYTRDGKVVVAGAHEDILVYRAAARRVEIVRPPGVWLGARSEIRHLTSEVAIQLHDGDALLLYTDGVTEAMNERMEQFDIARLSETFLASAHLPAQAMIDHLFATITQWMHVQFDDVTALVLKYKR